MSPSIRPCAQRRASIRSFFPLALFTMVSCFEPALTQQEAQEAVESANLASSVEALTRDVLAISTSFELGQAVEQAAEELRAFAASQIPCSDASLEGNQVTIDFGVLEDACAYRGRTYAGVVMITVGASTVVSDGFASGTLEVHHDWQGFTDGKITLDGEADVTWSTAEQSRRVKYMGTARFGSLVEGAEPESTLVVRGDVTQRLLNPDQGLRAGLEIDGTRRWHLEEGRTWKLEVENVEVRGQDPVPQAGRYVLTTPSGKEVTMVFARASANTVRINVAGPRNRSYDIDVISLGY